MQSTVLRQCGGGGEGNKEKAEEPRQGTGWTAREVLRDYPKIRILDLCKVVNDSAELDKWRKGKDVHYWKVEEQVVLGKAVAEAVITALDTRK